MESKLELRKKSRQSERRRFLALAEKLQTSAHPRDRRKIKLQLAKMTFGS